MQTGELKLVAYVRNGSKGMVLNKTNCKTIAGLYGPNADAWIGKAVELFATTCSAAGGETVECLRVKPRGRSTRSLSASTM
jgi:hypothetical protein